ncbi:hypothetical protein NEIG_01980 [Nematocida sp. ERTm5]|nr:hypothetical protein NEIRO02_1332 [Nematocida sp. AWRm79]KAI5183519.1 hypothetical protein NEIRO03_1109 [Nematocida sp. AWRm78]OAG33562.1 hypothetical protein NEIG_01980 [Nematocida sp. ERTm5]
MVSVVVFLVLCIFSVRCMNVEDMDRIYYKIQNDTKYVPGGKKVPGASILDEMNIQFMVGEKKKELSKYTPLIVKIDKLLNLAGKELVHSDKNNKIILTPFNSIKLLNDDGEVNVGYYAGSYIKKDRIIQKYINGDVCDICKSKNWTGAVHYIADSNETHLSGPVEASTCSYKFLVSGKDLASMDEYTVLNATLTHTDSDRSSDIKEYANASGNAEQKSEEATPPTTEGQKQDGEQAKNTEEKPTDAVEEKTEAVEEKKIESNSEGMYTTKKDL